MSQEQAVFQWAWVGARKDHPEFERFRLSANESLITAWVTSQGLTVNPATLTVALEEAVRSGCLPNGVRLAQKTAQRIVEDEAANEAAIAAAAAEKQRKDEIAAANRRFENLTYIEQNYYRNCDDHSRSVEMSKYKFWDDSRIEAFANGVRLAHEHKGQDAETFRQEVFQKQETFGPKPVVIPADVTAAKLKQMSRIEIRQLVKQLAVKFNHVGSDQAVWNALNRRIAGQE